MKNLFKKTLFAVVMVMVLAFGICFTACDGCGGDTGKSYNITGWEVDGSYSNDYYTYIEFKADTASDKVLDSVWVKINSFGEGNANDQVFFHIASFDSKSTSGSAGFLNLPLTGKGVSVACTEDNETWLNIAITQNQGIENGGADVVGTKPYIVLSVLGKVEVEEIVMVAFSGEGSSKTYSLVSLSVESVGSVRSDSLIKPLNDGARQAKSEMVEGAGALIDAQDSFELGNVTRESTTKYTYKHD